MGRAEDTTHDLGHIGVAEGLFPGQGVGLAVVAGFGEHCRGDRADVAGVDERGPGSAGRDPDLAVAGDVGGVGARQVLHEEVGPQHRVRRPGRPQVGLDLVVGGVAVELDPLQGQEHHLPHPEILRSVDDGDQEPGHVGDLRGPHQEQPVRATHGAPQLPGWGAEVEQSRLHAVGEPGRCPAGADPGDHPLSPGCQPGRDGGSDGAGELRTPITVVRGHMELVDVHDPVDVRQTRDLVLEEADRMGVLVNDLLMLARASESDSSSPAGWTSPSSPTRPWRRRGHSGTACGGSNASPRRRRGWIRHGSPRRGSSWPPTR